MATGDTIKFEADGDYCALESSTDGHAILRIILSRETRTGRRLRYEIMAKIERSSVFCIHKAITEFITAEKKSVDEWAKRLGLP